MIDKEILEYIKCSEDMDFTEVLKSDERLDVARYLSPLANGFLGWYPFEKNSNIYLIGSCFGAFAEQLLCYAQKLTIFEADSVRFEATRLRLRKYIENGKADIVNQGVEYLSTISIGNRADYIIIVIDDNFSSVEESNKLAMYDSILQCAYPHVRKGGRLIFAVPNTLGTAYLCGKKASPHTINKKELTSLVSRYFSAFKFYYPYPEAAIPQMVYSDDFLPNERAVELSERLNFLGNFQNRMTGNQKQLLTELMQNNVAEIFANSFVVEASDSAGNLSNIMYASISAERKRERSFATNICSDNIVRKMPLYSEGIKGLEKLHCNTMNMKNRGLTVLPLEITENHAEMSYIREGTLSKYMKDLSYREPSEDVRNEIYAIVDRIYEDILKSSEQVAEEKNCLNKFAPELDWGPVLRICYLEMIPVNTFIKKRDDGFDLVYFDQEFTYENCPAIFPLTRAIYDIYALSPLVEKHIPKKEMLEHYNLTELWEPSRKAEDEFQLWLRNRDVYVARGRWSSVYPRIINNSIKELERAEKRVLPDNERNEYDLFNPISGLGGRQIIIFGSGKQYQYYMDMLGELYPPAYVVDNNPEKWGGKCIGPVELKKLALGNYRIVIAVGAYEEIANQLTAMGITDYRVFVKNIYEKVSDAISNKITDYGKESVILFGTGKFAIHYMKLLGRLVKPVFAVDNNTNCWGSDFAGIKVEPPDKIIHLLQKGENLRIVVAVAKYQEIVEQLKSMGVHENSITIYNKEESFTCGDARDTIVNGKYGVGYLPGAFDMFHIGHLNVLKKSKEHCRYLIAGVISDDICRKEKHKEPIIPYEQRVEIVRQCKYVDDVVCIDDSITDKLNALKKLNFDVMFSGSDHDYLYHRRMFRSMGADFMQFSYTDGISSSKLREILKGDNV